MKKLGKKIMSMLVVVIISASFVGSAFAQNSLSWEQDGKRCTINLFTGDFSITCYDNAGNAFTIYGPEYDFEVTAAASGHNTIDYNGGRVWHVGPTTIDYNGGRVWHIGSTTVDYNGGKVWHIGSTTVDYNGGKVWHIGSTTVDYNGGKVWHVGGATINYNGGKVWTINGKVR